MGAAAGICRVSGGAQPTLRTAAAACGVAVDEERRAVVSGEGKTYRVERSYGSFLRSFTLPAGVDAAKVNAAYKNGVLEIALPKLAEAKAKQIKVEVK